MNAVAVSAIILIVAIHQEVGNCVTQAFSQEKTRRLVKREGLNNLLDRPLGSWMSGDVEMDNLTLVMEKAYKAIEHPKYQGWNGTT